MKKIPEIFLQYLWMNRLLEEKNLITSDGQPVTIIDSGAMNTDSGPDFFSAKIRIGDTLWAGDVEIHLYASDWIRHGHQSDKAYESVILHAVAYNDCQVTRQDGQPVPTLQMKYNRRLLEKYDALMDDKRRIACAGELGNIPSVFITQWLTSLGVERLMNRNSLYLDWLDSCGNDWQNLLHKMLAGSFGIPLNSLPFSMLADLLTLKILLRLKDNPFSLEALVFGKAGFLDQAIPEDPYMSSLFHEYKRISDRIKGNAVPVHLWKFMRLRPVSFPSVRLAQFAAVVNKSYPLLEKLLENPSKKPVMELLDVRAGDYWNTHYIFGKTSAYRIKKTGTGFLHTVIINAISPFLFFYGKRHGDDKLCESALRMLEELPPEKNTIIKNWSIFGIRPCSAFESQSLIQLFNEYCQQKRCLSCQIGVKLISGAVDERT